VRPRIGPLLILALLIALAGCAGLDGLSPSVTNEEARERGIAAEEQHITEQLGNASCVESWSLNSFVGLEEEASVTNRTADGVYVMVQHPYSYSTKQEEADVASEAQYLVTADDVDRLSGTHVSPC